MMKQKILLGALRVQLQALQVRPPGVMTLHLVKGASEAEHMLHTHTMNTLVLTNNAILAEVEGDMRRWGLNLIAFPEKPYTGYRIG